MYKFDLAVFCEIIYNVSTALRCVSVRQTSGKMGYAPAEKKTKDGVGKKNEKISKYDNGSDRIPVHAVWPGSGRSEGRAGRAGRICRGYCVMDTDTGEIIIHKNMDEQFYPASITKVLTALVTLENCDNLDDTITFSDWAINSCTANSSTMPPKGMVGEQMTVRDVLYGMLLSSGNECANALAEYIGGDINTFAEMMNEKAKELGATNSHFVNAHGLHDPNHYTTPHDMALIYQAALENPTFREIDSTATYTIPATNMTGARALSMGHKMVNGQLPFEGVFAGKTGNTAEAGRTLLTAAERNGHTLISVVMKSNNDKFYLDTEILLEYGFNPGG